MTIARDHEAQRDDAFGLGLVAALLGPIRSTQTQDKPGVLVFWGDVIGGFNISAYNHDVMG